MWHPDGDRAPGAEVPAFAEAGKPPEIPGPLIRVPAGTDVALTVHNAVPNTVLTVHGLYARPLTTPAADTLQIATGATRPVRFRLDAPGTYYYWGTTMGREFRGRTREDAQLSGAIIVDEPGQRAPRDRILVIGVWEDTLGGVVLARERERELMVVNGRCAGVFSTFRLTCIRCTCTASTTRSLPEGTARATPATRKAVETWSSPSG
jgi:FtsP/CotA-like multicopper oxidase with cupredoxin domain